MAASPTDRIMSEAPPSQSDIYTSQRWRYDVFLSFRGEDTRKKFTDHLYHALIDAGINAFRDDDSLERGEDISSALIRAIQSSRISVLVFSTNYAGSRWCLQELTEIMDCRKSSGQMVLPIFYDVDPSDVRHQTGTFAEAFDQHEKRYMSEEGSATIKQWKAALTEAASLSGWDLRAVANGHEANFVKKIVQQISNELKHEHLDVAKYSIGLDSRLAGLCEILNAGFEAVRFVGICGIGGVGKTTLAKGVYNEFSHTFEAKCFLADVRENSERPDGLLHLQEQLLSDILKLEEVKLGNVHRGISVIKERLRSRRVLVVLDDLSHLEQLRTLAGGPEWFGPGSRIIMTTRNLDLLKEVEAVPYMAPELTGDESLELFSLHAFRNRHPKEEYIGLSRAIVSYSEGLPLALEVLGSFLRDRSPVEWISTIEKLKEIPNNSLQAQLRISYDALGDDIEKSLFLDIACFFVGWNRDYVVKILNACGFFADIGLSILTERCLLGRDPCRLTMHDLLRDMGREIVREESPVNPGKRSRLWFYKDALATLINNQGGEEVEGILLDRPALDEPKVIVEAFARMTRLRLLQLNNVTLRGDYGLISKELRWLCWHNFPSNFISKDFYMGNLVMLDMQRSKLRVLWRDEEVLLYLKFMNLSHSHLLRKTPNFLKLPNLEELILEDCVGLVEVHQSIGCLQKLVLLNLKDCIKLKSIPDTICKVKSLQILNISGCSKINRLPEDIGEMISLREFLAGSTSVTQVPLSITHLKNLTDLSLCGCKVSKPKNLTGFSSIISPISSWLSSMLAPSISQSSMLISSVSGLTSLQKLMLSDCNLSDDTIPMGLERLSFLEELDLSKNYFSHLPDSISHLPNLVQLKLDDCVMLKAISHMPLSLGSLSARNCTSLERVVSVSIEFDLVNCSKLAEISLIDNWSSSDRVNIDKFLPSRRLQGCKSLLTEFKEFLLEDPLQRLAGFSWFPGSEIPHFFSYQGEGPSLSFRLPSNLFAKQHVPIIVCVVYGPNVEENTYMRSAGVRIRVMNTDVGGVGWVPRNILPPLEEDHMFTRPLLICQRISRIIDGEDAEVEVTARSSGGVYMKRLGVHLGRPICLEDCSCGPGLLMWHQRSLGT